VDAGERLEEAVRREVREECAIEVEVGPLLGVFEPLVWDDDGRLLYHYVVLDYLARYVSGDPVIGDDAAELRWVAFDDLDEYPLLAVTREMIERARNL
jgi:8-oxo-dGTP diphosphatase